MKVSVVVIAHNEAGYIRSCLESIRRQTVRPDEIILIAHNCTDDTVRIVREFSDVRIVELAGPDGVVYARIRGFEEAQGEIVACIDSDSYARKNWLQKLIISLSDPSVLAVGGGVWLTGGLIPSLMSLDFFWLKPIYRFLLRFWTSQNDGRHGEYFWGANFCIRKSVYEKIGGLVPFIQLIQKLGLSLAPEDLYLSLRVSEVGRVVINPWAVVVSSATKTNWKIRSRIQGQDKQKLINYLNSSREGS